MNGLREGKGPNWPPVPEDSTQRSIQLDAEVPPLTSPLASSVPTELTKEVTLTHKTSLTTLENPRFSRKIRG